jgi:tRNA threonylcarbamoyl adenosine modification protein YeaZ
LKGGIHLKILSIGTSTKNCTVAICEDTTKIAELNNMSGLTHSETLVPSVEKILMDNELSLDSIDAYAVSVGPGSFTGIRIGVATVKGFCLAKPKKVFAVPSLLALAYNVADFKGYIVSCIDARNDNVYAAIYDNTADTPEMIGDYISDNVQVLLDKIAKLDKKIIIVGDAISLIKEKLIETSLNNSNNLEFADDTHNIEYAGSIAKAAFDLEKRGLSTTGELLSPLYLKKSQAERELEEKEKGAK